MKELIKNIIMFLGIGLLLLIVIFSVSISIWGFFYDGKRDDYCLKLYPPKINEPSFQSNSWSESNRVESGYTRCCRFYYELHEKKIECQIFPYIKSNH